MSGYRLCYVSEPWAYFTTQPIAKQWGDDWNDAPYEHNADRPYTWRETVYRNGEWIPNPEPAWQITKLAWEGPLEDPALYERNSPWSVEAINAGACPWLRTDRYAGDDTPAVSIWAGCTLEEFARAVQSVGGSVYYPSQPEPSASPAGPN